MKKNGKNIKTVLISILAGIGVVVGAILGFLYLKKDKSYNYAVELATANKLDQAYSAFKELGDFKDSEERLAALCEKFPALPYRHSEKRDIVTFGAYEQDNNLESAEPIQWFVLDKIGDEVLLISVNCLEWKAYDSDAFEPVTWEESELREWLNENFYDSAFTDEEKKLITLADNSNPDNAVLETPGGNDTEDLIYLMCEGEANIYLADDMDRFYFGEAPATEYAIAQGAVVDESGMAEWWLRTPGGYEYAAQFVERNGNVYTSGAYVDIMYGVRPMLRLNTSLDDK